MPTVRPASQGVSEPVSPIAGTASSPARPPHKSLHSAANRWGPLTLLGQAHLVRRSKPLDEPPVASAQVRKARTSGSGRVLARVNRDSVSRDGHLSSTEEATRPRNLDRSWQSQAVDYQAKG